MMTEKRDWPHELYELVDEHIELAASFNQAWPRTRVAATLMYAAARYGADTWLDRGGHERQSEAEAADQFAARCREMFIENLADLRDGYAEDAGDEW